MGFPAFLPEVTSSSAEVTSSSAEVTSSSAEATFAVASAAPGLIGVLALSASPQATPFLPTTEAGMKEKT